MKSVIIAILSAPLLLSSLAAAAALPQQPGTGLPSIVPPPPCLNTCIERYGDCAICTPDGDANIQACYQATCEGPPNGNLPYAGVYYGSICSNGGYLDYTPSPPHFVTIPPANCT